ncbi:Rho guanine nucleotide exchange factor 12 [Eumeta japonica]|uniref:Rho guanine nucleotide exchange factor 12 n=1 Tax=Eumeta variegata TaxID=151549 RepID=A0A4C1UUD5_EUMVA|nr:Rho guanine nucleotide exchange factor 12 [Eumeta japonica]
MRDDFSSACPRAITLWGWTSRSANRNLWGALHGVHSSQAKFPSLVMPGGCAVTGSGCGGDELLTVTVVRDEHGYGMKVSGDNPVYVQSVKEHGAAWRAGLRAGDRILRVDGAPVHDQAHQTVVHMIRGEPAAVGASAAARFRFTL